MENKKKGRKKKDTAVGMKIYVRLGEEEVELIDRLCLKLGIEERSSFIRMAIRDALGRFYQKDVWELLREKAEMV